MFSLLVRASLRRERLRGACVTRNELEGLSSLWTRLPRRPLPDTKLALGIALAQHDVESAEKDLLRVSNPSSPQFAPYWDRTSWLRQAGVDQQLIVPFEDQGWLFFNTPILQTETLLMTEFAAYNNGEKHLACDHYSLPRLLHGGHPQLPSRSPNVVQSRGTAPSPQELCSKYTTPGCLRTLYNISSGDAIHPNNTLGVFEVAWSSWLPRDLDMFFGLFSPAQMGSRPTMERINGGYWRNDSAMSSLNMEADLDFEYTMALTYPQPVVNYQAGEMWQAGTLNGLLAAIDPSHCTAWNSSIDGTYPSPFEGGYSEPVDCSTLKPASVIFVAYAWDEVAYPPACLCRQYLEFLKLGLQGVSVDCGPAGAGCRCIDPGTGGVGPADSGLFSPVAPASCPYVLSVGGTQLRANTTVHDREVVFRVESPSHISSSGGGFSNLFAAPGYQHKAVRDYLENPLQQDCLTSLVGKGANFAGRSFPDVSANAANYVVAVAAQLMTVQGTSASAPVVASILSKLNNARLHAGKRPVGFVNPVLYAHPHQTNDVVGGANHGYGTDAFEAVVGWDPVTGLGTLGYRRLLELYLSLS
ncbi:peptidase S8/S53 domain-containing protein [Staphylotrichum tortipilum]|uniref:tripeptidyl-peptidase II n=1 Tax=Staphylotrichum tortipilum TaxID=2831512 RepID=A0AAN6MGK9_9PEZI|nr:peptidase S8/S53 domain-containing protein [Staphylotrichum longicolle]